MGLYAGNSEYIKDNIKYVYQENANKKQIEIYINNETNTSITVLHSEKIITQNNNTNNNNFELPLKNNLLDKLNNSTKYNYIFIGKEKINEYNCIKFSLTNNENNEYLKQVQEYAKKENLVPVVMLFDIHPRKLISGKVPPMLTSEEKKRELLTKIEAQGTRFFAVCGYNLPLLAFAGTKKLNSDSIVDFKSASLGGFSAAPNETLPKDYVPVYDRCQNREHNHISPDNSVDLGTAIFPDSTFCFKNQVHDDIAYNDVALLLCKEILTNEGFTDVYSDPRFPQFNGSRDIFRIKYRLLPKVDELLKKDLPEEIKNELLACIQEVDKLFANTIIENRTQADELTKRFDDVVKKAEEV